jgi:PAS domain S-box-containing protein
MPFIVIDKQGIVLSFNAGAELMLGYCAKEVVNRNVSMLVPEPYRQSHDGYLQHYLETGEAGIIGKSRDFNIFRKDGEILPINLRVTEMETIGDPMFIGVIHDISERKEYEQQLTHSIEEKKTLLKEIHHRVKNNLMVVSSILEMQEDRNEDSDLNRILKVSQDRIQSMALIHEKLYRSPTLAEVDFGSYLDEIVDRLVATYRADTSKIEVIKNISPIHLNVETATPLGLIVNELIANCLKHAFVGGATGEVRIFCDQSEDGLVTLCVSDDGRGLPEDFDLDQVGSLGMQLVYLLSRKLDANLIIENKNGARFCLEFNEMKYQTRM